MLRQVRNLHQWIDEAWKLMTVHKTHEIISTYNIKKKKSKAKGTHWYQRLHLVGNYRQNNVLLQMLIMIDQLKHEKRKTSSIMQ